MILKDKQFRILLIAGLIWGLAMFVILGMTIGFSFLSFVICFFGGILWGLLMYVTVYFTKSTKRTFHANQFKMPMTDFFAKYDINKLSNYDYIVYYINNYVFTSPHEFLELYEYLKTRVEENQLMFHIELLEKCNELGYIEIKDYENLDTQSHALLSEFQYMKDKNYLTYRFVQLASTLLSQFIRIDLNDFNNDAIIMMYFNKLLRVDSSNFEQLKIYIDKRIIETDNEVFVDLEYASLKGLNETLSLLDKEIQKYKEFNLIYTQYIVEDFILDTLSAKYEQELFMQKAHELFYITDSELAYTIEYHCLTWSDLVNCNKLYEFLLNRAKDTKLLFDNTHN